MKLTPFLSCVALFIAAASARAGTIEGTVVNTSSGTPVPCQVMVALQIRVKGEFIPFRETVSDNQGHFRFERLAIGDGIMYQPGATRHGVFYPGPRIALTDLEPAARTQLSVCDAVASPSPLVLKKMDITIRPETGLLKVTESLLLENPSRTCYVGEAAHDGAEPITLQLSIPPDFERTTFDEEFFGRRFAVANHKLVTNVPWPPGERRLRYTYIIHNTQEVLQWKRPLDLPCADVTVRVEGKSPSEVRCQTLRRTVADEKTVVYESAGQVLPTEQVLEVELGRLPLPWMAYGKWAALAVLLVLIAGTAFFHFRRGHRQAPARAPGKTLTVRQKNRKRRAA